MFNESVLARLRTSRFKITLDRNNKAKSLYKYWKLLSSVFWSTPSIKADALSVKSCECAPFRNFSISKRKDDSLAVPARLRTRVTDALIE